MEKKYSELIQRLYKLTKERKLEWRKTSSENEYMLELNAATFAISKGIEYYNNSASEFIAVSMYNDKNMVIPIVSVTPSAKRGVYTAKIYTAGDGGSTLIRPKRFRLLIHALKKQKH